jgi:uncharacterized SAM-binding protein YcdF (DUF218 family)
MFFILSKTVSFFLLPSNVLIAIAVAGVVLLFTRWRRAGQRLMVTGIVLLVLVGFLPVWAILEHGLESRFPPWDPGRGAPDGIVVLGGAIDPVLSRIYGTTQVIESAERITVIAELARDYPKARIIFSGGDGSLSGNAGSEADYLYPILDTFGVPRTRVELEGRSRNTYENAAFSKVLAKPKPGERWLLVTSAWHMPRAVGCFRRAGFPVEAYPVDWHVAPELHLSLSRRFGAGLSGVDTVVHEYIGLVAYWISGRTSALFPAPDPAR